MAACHQQPANIQRVLREQERRAAAASYAASINTGSTVAAWHDRPTDGRAASGTTQHLAAEAKLDRQARLHRRQQQLKQLWAQEQAAYEAELRHRGLALTKNRL